MGVQHINFTTTFSFECDTREEAMRHVERILDVGNVAKMVNALDPKIKFLGMNGIKFFEK